MENPSLEEYLNNAQIAYKGEDFEGAAKWYERAEIIYREAGSSVKAAEMANNRSVALLRAGKALQAFQASTGTERIFAQAGDDHNQAISLGNQAAALEAVGKTNEAIELYQQCNEILKQSNQPSLRIYVLESLSALYLRRWRFFEALVAMEVALELKNKLSFRERILKFLMRVISKLSGR